MTPLPKTKSVLIVGAGPAGLVAAKTFKQYGYTVAVYEAADCVGGMWRTKRGGPGDKCSYDMHTNLSRFTVSFSDLSWSSVDLEYLYDSHRQENPPMFPMAWQVGEYLKTYAKQFDIMSSVHLQKRVSSANVNKDNTWDVSYVDASGQLSKSRTFDYLIVANGYFDKPAHSFDPSPSKNLPNIQHSSRFRDLSGLTSTSGKVVVIGGGISGSEAASQAAFQISNAQYAPSETKPAHAASKVYHVINRPFYCLPRYLPTNPRNEDGKPALAPKFLPIDLILHDISRRGSEVISAAITTMPPEKAQKGHAFIRDCLGGDQRDVGHSELVYKTDQTQYPAYTGITDTYKEFVRSGILVPVQGQVEEVKQQVNSDLLDVSIKQSAPWQLNNITASLLASRSLLGLY
jgi:thioredoxin reductase